MNTETTKFTPGPWELIFAEEDRIDKTWWEIEGPNIEHIAQCNMSGGNTRETELANAQLIVCAPELLAALEETWKIACGSCRWDRSPKGCNNDCHNLKYKQLIAKAKRE